MINRFRYADKALSLLFHSSELWEEGAERENLSRGKWDFSIVVQMSEVTVKVDGKGRIVIPSWIRRQLNIKNIIKIRVEGGEITLKPVEDPLRSLEKLVIKGTTDVEREIRRIREVADRELQKEA